MNLQSQPLVKDVTNLEPGWQGTTSLDGSVPKTGKVRRKIAVAAALLLDSGVVISLAAIIPFFELNQADREVGFRVVAMVLAIYYVIGLLWGAFEPAAFLGRRAFVGRAARSFIAAFMVTFVAFFSLKVGSEYSRLVVGVLAVSGVVAISAMRLFAHPWFRHQVRQSISPPICIVDGVFVAPPPGMFMVNAAEWGITPNLDDFVNIERVGRLCAEAERVVVYCDISNRLAWSELLKCLAVRSEICAPELAAFRPLSIDTLGGTTTLVVSENPLEWHQALTKRVFDLVLTGALLLLISPVLVVVAIAIRLESPGPAFFLQERVGFGNRRFVMFKFRSMRNELADPTAFKLTERDDPRITRVGNFIRRTSIDELPQLINVMLGDMSLVGPRPHAPAALAGGKLYWEVDQSYWHRHVAKPGITGLAQVRGLRGNTFEECDLQTRLDADLEYLNNWSLLKDIEILLATAKVMTHSEAF